MRHLVILTLLVASRAEANDGGVCPNPQPVMHIAGAITAELVPYVLDFLKTFKSPRMVISSKGGSMHASTEIYQAVKAHGNVTCVVKDHALSGAATIFQACRYRQIYSTAKLGLHEPSGYMPEPLNRVGAALWVQYLESISRTWNEMTRYRMTLTSDQYEHKVKGKDWILSADEALMYGAADRIIP